MALLKTLWNKWKQLAEKIGNFQAAVIFSILYIVIVTPLGIIVNLFKDYFKIKSFPVWDDMEDTSSTLVKLKEQ